MGFFEGSFPELRLTERLRSISEGFGSKLIGLDIERKDVMSAQGITFNTVNADWYARNGYRGIYSALGGGSPSWSGQTVSLDTALNHSVVWACNRIISETIGFLPLNMMQETSKGKNPAVHPFSQAIKMMPNIMTTSMNFREALTSHMVLGGNAFAKIIRRSGTGVAIGLEQLLPASVVNMDYDKNSVMHYLIKDGNSAEKSYPVLVDKPQEILHMRGIGSDGIRGYSVIKQARQSIGTALGGEEFAGKFWSNGGRVPYVLKADRRWPDDDSFNKFRAEWEETYSNPHKAPILEPWLTYEKIGMSLADCQLLEARQFAIPEICRWFGISPHLVGDLSRATFANIEQLALEFEKMTLTAWFTRWEQELWRCVLTPEEKGQGYYFKHNAAGLLRGDFVSRMAGYASALQNGTLSQDEVRDMEDRNPIPDGSGQFYRVQLNMQPLVPDPAAAYLAQQQARQQPGISKGPNETPKN